MDINKTTIQPIKYRESWFSYFDLLGFSRLVREHIIEYVLPLYEEVLETIAEKAGPKEKHGISYSWFSDTFIVYTKSDSLKDFGHIEQASRLFFQKLIIREIPVRGAMTIGKLYTNKVKNIFLGEALIDAYEYAEDQDWLGFILTPSIYHKLKNGPFDLSQRLHYRRVENSRIFKNKNRDNVYAFAFNNGALNGRNAFIDAIQSMKRQAGEAHIQKYRNTEQFIEKHGRMEDFTFDQAKDSRKQEVMP